MIGHLLLVVTLAMQADTVIILGEAERDLTGDGRPEVLRLVGAGPSIDSLEVTFTIASSGEVLFRTALSPLTRTVGFDGGRRIASALEHRNRIADFGQSFFAAGKFSSPGAFMEHLSSSASHRIADIPHEIARHRREYALIDSLTAAGRSSAEAERRARRLLPVLDAADSARGREIWNEIQSSPVTAFEFSNGGDHSTAIAWSSRERRFYRLFVCC